MRFHCANALVVLRSTSEGTLVTKESARFDNNDNEPKSQVRSFKFPEENYSYLKTHTVESVLSFSQCHDENECIFDKRQVQTTKWKNTKRNCKTTGEVPSQI